MGGFAISIPTFLLTVAALLPTPIDAAPKIQNARVAMVIAPKDFTDQEYFDQRAIFDGGGALVYGASVGIEAVISHDLANVRVDMALADLRLGQFDALDIVGGTGAITYLLDNEALRNMIIAAFKSNKVVAAICAAPAIYKTGTVVASNRVVTANGPEAAKEHALRVLSLLKT